MGYERNFIKSLSHAANCFSIIRKGKDYENFLKYILERDEFFDEENNDFPSVKEVARRTKLPYDRVIKFLKMIYTDLLGTWYDGIYWEFADVEYVFPVGN